VLSKQIDDLEPTLTRHGYTAKVLCEKLGTKPGEIKALFNQSLEVDRTRKGEHDNLLAVGVHEVRGRAAVGEYVPRMTGANAGRGQAFARCVAGPSCSSSGGGSLPPCDRSHDATSSMFRRKPP
jgi:hypothetical protein